jgi:hypothetical protein
MKIFMSLSGGGDVAMMKERGKNAEKMCETFKEQKNFLILEKEKSS